MKVKTDSHKHLFQMHVLWNSQGEKRNNPVLSNKDEISGLKKIACLNSFISFLRNQKKGK